MVVGGLPDPCPNKALEASQHHRLPHHERAAAVLEFGGGLKGVLPEDGSGRDEECMGVSAQLVQCECEMGRHGFSLKP